MSSGESGDAAVRGAESSTSILRNVIGRRSLCLVVFIDQHTFRASYKSTSEAVLKPYLSEDLFP